MKIICIGLNYKDHAREMNRELPSRPLVFIKPDSAIIRNDKPFFIPDYDSAIDYEAELVLSICKVGRSIAPRYAHRYFDKITVGIDFTARDLQKSLSDEIMPWSISKGFDGSAPLGKFISVSSLGSIDDISFSLEKNGVTVQSASSSGLIFSFADIIAYVSRFFTLKTGDLIFTGTPAGAGPVKKNDRLTAFLEGQKVLDFNVK